MTFGRITALLGVLFAIALALIFAAPDLPWILPVAAANEATGIDQLFLLMLVVSVGIFIFVQGFLLYFVWLYRRRPEDSEEAVGRSLHGDNRLEIAWTVAPALFLILLTILSVRVFNELQLGNAEAGERQIEVVAQQFFWRFSEPRTGLLENGVLTLQKGESVTLAITAEDVNHAFWVPEFRLKQDATPGFTRYITFTPSMTHVEAGPGYEDGFPLRCAEFCGEGHSAMLARVRVLEPAEFAAWEQEALQALAEAAEGGRGLQVYNEQGCAACHALDRANAAGQVGPTHNDLATTAATRAEATGAESAEAYLRTSIRDPNSYIVPPYPAAMPAYGEDKIPEEDLAALVEFLLAEE